MEWGNPDVIKIIFSVISCSTKFHLKMVMKPFFEVKSLSRLLLFDVNAA